MKDIFFDNRGNVTSIYKENDYPNLKFVEDRSSFSVAGVLRGLHGDNKTWKLITCLYGTMVLTVVDARKESKTYGFHKTHFMYASDKKSVLIPPRFINGHYALSDCVLYYKWSEYYAGPENQVTVMWNDTSLGINWWNMSSSPILSERDKNGLAFKDITL
jgi:dTDP-4-dehydrorhamnose 3,5-epimerase